MNEVILVLVFSFMLRLNNMNDTVEVLAIMCKTDLSCYDVECGNQSQDEKKQKHISLLSWGCHVVYILINNEFNFICTLYYKPVKYLCCLNLSEL